MCLQPEDLFFNPPGENLNIRGVKRRAEPVEDKKEDPFAKIRKTEVCLEH